MCFLFFQWWTFSWYRYTLIAFWIKCSTYTGLFYLSLDHLMCRYPGERPERSFTVINASCRCCFMCLGEFQSRQAGCSDGEALLWSLIKNCELYIHHALVSGSLEGPRLLYAPSFLLLLLFVFARPLPRFLTVMKVALTSYHQNH